MFARLTNRVTHALGSPWAVLTALGVIVVWLCSGPAFGFSDTWQLIINTGTTIVTFVMVFVIQAAQNRDNLAMQTKLDAIIAALPDADDQLRRIEERPEPEIERERRRRE